VNAQAQAQAQMMQEKMRRQKMMEQQQRQQQQQQQQQQHAAQYMNRPPPDYKAGPGRNVNAYAAANNGMGPNPLQTMQNMVNQTNTLGPGGAPQQQAYGPVKTESGAMPMHMGSTGSMMEPTMAAMQQMSAASVAVSSAGMMPGSSAGMMPGAIPQNNTSRSPVTTYPVQQQPGGVGVQRQHSFPGTVIPPNQAQQSQGSVAQTQRPNAPTYTSAIMRNQRPPNVNVGPDGLNISQPRNPHDWPPRPAMMQQSQVGPRGGVMSVAPSSAGATMTRPPMSAAAVMQYGSYANQRGMVNVSGAPQQHVQSGRSIQMNAMQAQSVAMQGNAAQVQAQHVLMQQQSMQLSQQQRIAMSAAARQQPPMSTNQQQVPAYSMPSPAGMSNSMNGQTTGFGEPGTSPQPHDDFMNLLDSAAQNGNTDFFDGMVQNSAGATDSSWLDEILGK
jgi:hypothetical protein